MGSITCEQKVLADALAAVKPVASKHSGIQALAGVKINTHVDGVFLACTDMDTYVLRRLDAEQNGTVEAIVPLGLLQDAVKLCAKFERVTLTQGESEVAVQAGPRKITLRTLRLEDFPPAPAQGGKVVLVANGDELGRVIERAGKFNSKDQTRPVLTGMHFGWADRIELAVTDSYRLGVFTVPGEKVANVAQNPDENMVTVGGAGLLLAAKAMRKHESVSLTVNATHSVVEIGDTIYMIRNVDGQYPNWRQLMPDSFEHEITLPVAELLDASEVAVKFLSRNAPARLWANGHVKLHGTTPDVGGFEETLENAKFTSANMHPLGEVFEIGLNPDFLRDIAKNYATDTAVMKLISPLRPALFEDGDDRYLLMPIRLQV